MAAFDYEAAKAQYGAQRARQMQAEAQAAPGGGNQPINVSSFQTPQAPGPVNLGEVSPQQSGIQAWGAEIGDQNRQTANMTPEQRARWAMEHIESFDQGSKNPASRQDAFNQWMAWDKSYDANCPPNTPYRGRGGQCAEKPDDCPPGTSMHGSSCVPTDQLPAWAGGQGGGGGAPQPGQQPGGGAPGVGTAPNPLQDQLVNLYQERGNMFNAQRPGGFGDQLSGGGIFWGQGGQGAVNPAVNPALASAALNAFTPAAPSQQMAKRDAPGGVYSDPYEAAKQGGTFAGAVGGMAQAKGGAPQVAGAQPAIAQPPAPSPLNAALAGKFKDPNQWWARGGVTGRTV